MKSLKINVKNMVCNSCETLIKDDLMSLDGVISVDASFKNSTAHIQYDENKISEDRIIETLKNIGYPPKNDSSSGLLLFIAFVFIYLFISKSSLFNFDFSNMLNSGSLIVIFFIGVLSSFHCIGMCGGIMLTQTLNKTSNLKSTLLYNIGRIISYTFLGGIVGLIGSVFSLTPNIQGAIQIFAAIFMFITALNILDISLFKKFKLSIPISCSIKRRFTNPFIVGILNGLMPCGPLQTMQIYALSTGSFYLGAISMFVFALGTTPLMLLFGSISTILKNKYSKEILKFSGIFLIILSLTMVQRGFALIGVNYNKPANSNLSNSNSLTNVVDGVQELTLRVTSSRFIPNKFVVEKDKPVKLTIVADSVSFCTNKIYFSSLDVRQELSSGSSYTLEFTPTETGEIPFSCWMGMKIGTISVVDKLDSNSESYNKDDSDINRYDLEKYFPGGFPSCH